MPRPFQVGIQLPEVERLVRWPEIRDMVVTAEAIGFDSIWVGDHLLYDLPEGPRGPWESWSLLAAIAAATGRVTLGPLVASTSFHNPAMLAKKAATVDEISGGRLIVGLGAGWNRIEYDAYGFPYDHRASRFEEAFTIIRTLLHDGYIDFAGTYYQARDCHLTPRSRPEGPPLMVGSTGPRILRATLPYIDMWNTWYDRYGNTPSGLTSMIHTVDEAATSVGTNPGDVAKTAAVLVQTPGGTGRGHGDPERAGTEPIKGDHEAVARSLLSFAATGVDHLQLVVDPITVAAIEWLAPVLDLLDRSEPGSLQPP